jgi:mono/diheme cytochrome c family protein
MKRIHLLLVVVILFLYSCGGSPDQSGPSNPALIQVVSGENVYAKTCVACHQAKGEGVSGTFPPLAKSDYLSNKELVIKQVLKGSSGEITVNGKTFNNTMPPQALSDNEIAAVLTYVYGNFGNGGGTITPDEVKTERAKQ